MGIQVRAWQIFLVGAATGAALMWRLDRASAGRLRQYADSVSTVASEYAYGAQRLTDSIESANAGRVKTVLKVLHIRDTVAIHDTTVVRDSAVRTLWDAYIAEKRRADSLQRIVLAINQNTQSLVTKVRGPSPAVRAATIALAVFVGYEIGRHK